MTTKEPVQVPTPRPSQSEESRHSNSSSSVSLSSSITTSTTSTSSSSILSQAMVPNSNCSVTMGNGRMSTVMTDAIEQKQEGKEEEETTTTEKNLDSSHIPPTPTSSYRHAKMKQAPICQIPALRKEHMTAMELSNYCFKSLNAPSFPIPNRVSSYATMRMMDSDGRSHCHPHHQKDDPSVVTVNPKAWDTYKRSILQRQESRTGRDRQRFDTDPVSGERIRLVTGTVPIMKNGHILLVSSSSKPEWILPKGGWESDESCEISALRETYEEGGILGTLGPRLDDVEFETRKGKKRRLELESLKKKVQIAYGTTELPHEDHVVPVPSSVTALSSSVSVSSTDRNSETYPSEDDMQQPLSHNVSPAFNKTRTTVHHTFAENIESSTIIKGSTCKKMDDNASTGSVASITSEHSSSANNVRMIMFPLYVLEVREHWPESGRARKVVDIDTAIQIMETRPEFQKVLINVKENGYHLMPCENKKLDWKDSYI